MCGLIQTYFYQDDFDFWDIPWKTIYRYEYIGIAPILHLNLFIDYSIKVHEMVMWLYSNYWCACVFQIWLHN